MHIYQYVYIFMNMDNTHIVTYIYMHLNCRNIFFKQKDKLNGTKHKYILQALDENTEYQMRVMSVNKYGFSVPSPLLSAYTLSSGECMLV